LEASRIFENLFTSVLEEKAAENTGATENTEEEGTERKSNYSGGVAHMPEQPLNARSEISEDERR